MLFVGDTPRALSEAELDEVAERVSTWVERQAEEVEAVTATGREPGERRWFVRLHGDEKDSFTVWFDLRQRTLHYETYVMPAPEENREAVYELMLRRNVDLYGANYQIGVEDAVLLAGHFPADAVTDAELDRVLGSLYAWVERDFRPLLRLGFASRLAASAK